jgi:mono/diheme cytochrome c family protein
MRTYIETEKQMNSAIILIAACTLTFSCAVPAFCQEDASDRGKEVYAVQKCALCHSIAGIGGKKMPLDRVGSKLKPEELRAWIRTPKTKKGDSAMKAYPNLPEKDLNNLIAFLMTLR